jgi:diguanylate cyclase (GGDEF)-like protein
VPPTWWWAYLLVLVPVISDALETGRWPSHPRDFVTEVVMGLVVAVFVRRIHRGMVQLRAQAETDPLTGLASRRRFLEDLRREVGRSSRSDLPLTVAILDVDGFKKVNDERGHAAGDVVLCAVADWMRRCARREVDAWYRIGGDEFALILAGLSRSEAVTLVGGACRRSGAPPEDADVTVSWGVAELEAGEDEDKVIGRADLEMYRAKSGQSTTGGTLWLQIFDSSGRPVDGETQGPTPGRHRDRRWGRLMAMVAIAAAAVGRARAERSRGVS